ncbi:MAG: radical SAM protein [Candidatus Woesearchaeota archaeon]
MKNNNNFLRAVFGFVKNNKDELVIKNFKDLNNVSKKLEFEEKNNNIRREEVLVEIEGKKRRLVPSLNDEKIKKKIKIKNCEKIYASLKNQDLLKKLIYENFDLIGILNGRIAFNGPNRAEIYLTNRCNNRCVACWDKSPFLKITPEKERWNNLEMDFETAKKVIEELAEIGCKNIYLSGGGEPFMHPKIMDILRIIKDKGMVCGINTNFTLLNGDKIKELVDLKIDYLLVSLWASNPKTYLKTHPGQNKETFSRIKNNLKLLKKLKYENNTKLPQISLYNVIFKYNYAEVEEMFEFALEVGAEYCFLVPVDIVDGATEHLALGKKEMEFIIKKEKDILKKINVMIEKNKDIPDHEENIKRQFSNFMRRISEDSAKKGIYDFNLVNSIPCYVGWTYLRVLPEGEVTTCLKSHFKPIGERYYVNNNSLKKLWFSEKYSDFRNKALTLKKDSQEFKKFNIPCEKSCDNYEDNLIMHNKFKSLSFKELIILHIYENILTKK